MVELFGRGLLDGDEDRKVESGPEDFDAEMKPIPNL